MQQAISTIKIHKINETYIKIFGDANIERDIAEFFTFKVPGCEYSPKYKARLWDGTISLYNLRTKTLPIGLYGRLYTFCVENRISIEFIENENFQCVVPECDVDLNDIKDFVDQLNLWQKAGPLTIRDYQLDAIFKAIKDRKTLLLSPTSCLDPEEDMEVFVSDEDYLRLERLNIINLD